MSKTVVYEVDARSLRERCSFLARNIRVDVAMEICENVACIVRAQVADERDGVLIAWIGETSRYPSPTTETIDIVWSLQ